MVAGAPPLDTQTPEENRAGVRAVLPLTGAPTALADVTDTTLPGPGGAIPVRVYRPSNASQLPVVAYFHGGGWLLGDLDSHDSTCRDIARYAEAVVVAVHYRLAPENPFPAAYEDCLAVTKALLDDSAGLGTDRTRVAIAGDSAGGNLAAGIAQALRGSSPGLVHQVLIYPLMDARLHPTGSSTQFSEGHFLSRRDLEYFVNTYAGAADRQDWRLSPGLAKDLSGLPAATVLTAECDPLRDDGESYAAALRSASVPVEYRCFEGQVHPFVMLGGIIDAANEARRLIGEQLRQSFARAP
ncbi:alpha/beta hydrolase [Hyalangium minutum]|uniref:Alpha/beta hydrolase domain protein n=1 Tax=Hyalangium minutum TaxID=394096 RepID=A0A085WHY6_9BACT|nr:alpha/beta hydrolase [Hyalangium minutum]KFE67299.1 alpha/beta hydrolase domain protein [Hyalangium minutum]KFE67386.1 Esterase/lipase [Hyalangium minutum]